MAIVVSAPLVEGKLANQAQAFGVEIDSNEDNNVHTVDTVVGVADLSLVFPMGSPLPPLTIYLGETYSYTLSVSNLGPDAAFEVTVVDILSPGMEFVSANQSQGSCDYDPGAYTLSCNLGSINKDDYEEVVVYFKAVAIGPIANEAMTGSEMLDPDINNNFTEFTSTVILDVQSQIFLPIVRRDVSTALQSLISGLKLPTLEPKCAKSASSSSCDLVQIDQNGEDDLRLRRRGEGHLK